MLITGWIKEHPLLLLLALATALTFAWLMAVRRRLGIKWYAAALTAALNMALGVLSVKLFAVIEAGFDFSAFSKQSLFGAVLILPLAYLAAGKLFKRKAADVFDCMTPPVVLTLFCARISCILTGCCLGTYMPGGAARWPTREAELVFYAAFLAVMIPRILKERGRGTAWPIFMIAYGAFRFVCEFFRESRTFAGVFHLSHVWAMLSLLLGLSILFEIRRRSQKHTSKKAR
ncbi:MAG: prolipoprotein diacylglyceryl transferase [Clostridia bacterium]|nr:prolipoprotein diacylglyceryl transferase [Clostridia bacterium]